MNQEYDRIQALIKKAEEKAINGDECLFRNGFHIMPPTGWLNDPNGLCQINGEYHLFFQYSPLDARGGMKAWGHYVTKDFVNLTYLGAPFVPDEEFDKNGVYSGSSFVDSDGMHIFYTGNVKLPGDHDYTYSGRRADTVLVESKDGRSFTEKKVVIDTDEYPEGYSCHIRDPKVWKEKDTYYMVLGARTSNDEGRILVYKSSDMKSWKLTCEVGSKEKFGYMWECPDYFKLGDAHVISFSPQGLEDEEFCYQNKYQSGYVLVGESPADCDSMTIDEDKFIEWDMGFDFYAPQTFLDESGRRIIVGWAGMPDAKYSNGEVKPENWQHCFTVPRELKTGIGKDGVMRVFQNPIKEIDNLRIGEPVKIIESDNKYLSKDGLVDIVCDGISGAFSVIIDDAVAFSYDKDIIKLTLNDDYGFGRNIRKAKINDINSLRILVDSSIIEYYINDGEMVFTTRFYKKVKSVKTVFDMKASEITIYPMNSMTISCNSGGLKWEN